MIDIENSTLTIQGLLAALANNPDDTLRLPDQATLLQLLQTVDINRPKSWDSYNSDSGRFIHNGDAISDYYRKHFPLALLLITEPELTLPDKELRHALEPYIRRMTLEDWVAAAAPYFAKDAKPSNHDPRPFFEPIIADKLETAVLTEDHISDWSWMIDETLEKIPTVKDKAAELYCDLAGAAYSQKQWYVLEDALPIALEMNGANLNADFIFNAAVMMHEERGITLAPIFDAAKPFEGLRHAVTTARRCIRLFDAGRYDTYDRTLKCLRL